jgi:hypothetical protein
MHTNRVNLSSFLPLAIVLLSSCSDGSDPTDLPNDGPETLAALVDPLPGSQSFIPDGTWWGYNMSKIVRSGNRVFTYVIENDDSPSTHSTFRIYMKEGIRVDGGGWLRHEPAR